MPTTIPTPYLPVDERPMQYDYARLKASAPERIWLLPGEDLVDGGLTLLWCDEPAPTEDCDPAAATEYVRAEARPLQEVQAHEGDPKWRAEVSETRFTQARKLLEDLAHREQRYRWAHDTHGEDSLAAGQAWDQMRRAGFQAREYLRNLEARERQAS